MTRFLALTILCLATTTAMARDVYQQPQEFITQVFAGNPPQPQLLWITKTLNQDIQEILGHELGVLRIRYWQHGGKTAWILEETGKEQLITTGLVVNNGKIDQLKVLIYRESRGMEVRHPFFTDQFKDAYLQTNKQLDRSIDGISGATVSVRALTKLARLALFLHHHVNAAP
ncbi:MAG TPA: FMN-binding protein [Gammaproteobacteria bacterium]